MRKLKNAVLIILLAALMAIAGCQTAASEQGAISMPAPAKTAGLAPQATKTPTPTPAAAASPSAAPSPDAATATDAAPPPNAPISYEVGLFSWEERSYGKALREDLYVMLKALNVTELYQSFDGSNMYDSNAAKLMTDLDKMKVKLYMLAGSREWGLDPEGKGMLEAVRQAVELNESVESGGFAGIIFDVESFLNEAWKEDPQKVMTSFVSGARLAYEEAKRHGLYIIHCIPIWYDDIGYDDELTALILECSDEVSVMNYNRRDEYSNMERELELARDAGKHITCIFEFQSTDYHGLTENETYYHSGISEAVTSFESLYRRFDYPKLKFAYHYFLPLRDLL